MKTSASKLTLAGLVMFLAALPVQAAGNTVQTLIDSRAAAIVNVKVVLKLEINVMGQSQDKEQRLDVQGVVVDPSGLVMLSSALFSDERYKSFEARAQGRLTINAKPSDFKVIFEREEKEYTAFLAATDSKLELAFLQVEELADKKPVAVDFAAAKACELGQQVYSVSRLGKGYDYAPVVQRGLVVGAIAKPRKASIVEETIAGLGLPIFDDVGGALGVLTALASGLKDEGDGEMDQLMAMMGMGSMGGDQRSFLLPGAVVAGVVEQAKKRAVEVGEERAKAKAEEQAKGETQKDEPKQEEPPKKDEEEPKKDGDSEEF